MKYNTIKDVVMAAIEATHDDGFGVEENTSKCCYSADVNTHCVVGNMVDWENVNDWPLVRLNLFNNEAFEAWDIDAHIEFVRMVGVDPAYLEDFVALCARLQEDHDNHAIAIGRAKFAGQPALTGGQCLDNFYDAATKRLEQTLEGIANGE